MLLIKRYANRKLYNTSTKKYITLDKLAELVRAGVELQVVDNTSGDDLTALTLSQIILEQEKKNKGFLPRSVLNALVEAGGKPLSSLRKRLESPLGFLHQVDQEIERRIQLLVQQGEIAEDRGKKLSDQLTQLSRRSNSVPDNIDEKIQQILQMQDIPTSDDIQNLIEQVNSLSKKINTFK